MLETADEFAKQVKVLYISIGENENSIEAGKFYLQLDVADISNVYFEAPDHEDATSRPIDHQPRRYRWSSRSSS